MHSSIAWKETLGIVLKNN